MKLKNRKTVISIIKLKNLIYRSSLCFTNFFLFLSSAAIDSKPPQSTQQSIKKKDQMKRNAMIKRIQLQEQGIDESFNQVSLLVLVITLQYMLVLRIHTLSTNL